LLRLMSPAINSPPKTSRALRASPRAARRPRLFARLTTHARQPHVCECPLRRLWQSPLEQLHRPDGSIL